MNANGYRKVQGIMAAFVGAGVAVAAMSGQTMVALAVVLAGMAMMFLFRRKVTGTISDEMMLRFSEAASRRAFQVFTFAAGMFGVFALVMKDSLPQYYETGQVLAYSACALMMLYTAFYAYYGRKGLK